MKLQVFLLNLSIGDLAGPCKAYDPVSSMEQHGTIPIPPGSAQTASVPLSLAKPPSPTHTNSHIFRSDDGADEEFGSQTSQRSESTSAVAEDGDADGAQATMTSPTIIHGTLISNTDSFSAGTRTSGEIQVTPGPESISDITGSLVASPTVRPVEGPDIDTSSLVASESNPSIPFATSDQAPMSSVVSEQIKHTFPCRL